MNPVLKKLHNYFTNLDPGPHRKLFLKPLHTQSTAAFCSGCDQLGCAASPTRPARCANSLRQRSTIASSRCIDVGQQ